MSVSPSVGRSVEILAHERSDRLPARGRKDLFNKEPRSAHTALSPSGRPNIPSDCVESFYKISLRHEDDETIIIVIGLPPTKNFTVPLARSDRLCSNIPCRCEFGHCEIRACFGVNNQMPPIVLVLSDEQCSMYFDVNFFSTGSTCPVPRKKKSQSELFLFQQRP